MKTGKTRAPGAFRREDLGSVRRSQVLTSYGPGAIIDLRDHSVVVESTAYWDLAEATPLPEPRLERSVRALLSNVVTLHPTTPLRYPPTAPDTLGFGAPKAVGMRGRIFPEWFKCQKCDFLGRRHEFDPREKNSKKAYWHRCDNAASQDEAGMAVPIRFVVSCTAGHLSDVDWQFFVHRDSKLPATEFTQHALKLVGGASGDLADVRVVCQQCDIKVGVLDAMAEGKSLGKCSGRRPWLGYGREFTQVCTETPRLVVRTASDLWTPKVESAFRLPQASVAPHLVDEIENLVKTLQSLVPEQRLLLLDVLLGASKATGEDQETIRREVHRQLQGEEDTPKSLRPPEFERFVKAPSYRAGLDVEREEFLVSRTPLAKPVPGIAAVITAHRLTETRALIGFHRLSTRALGAEKDRRLQPVCGESGWLPAVQILGEGVFVQLDTAAVQAWEQRPEVQARALEFQRAWAAREKVPSMGEILVHSLAHLLMQAMALRCGYGASALRERLYVGDDSGGDYALLLHTGVPGSDGTLGGLAEQAKHLEAHLIAALRHASLCSNDPVCGVHRPGDGGGSHALDGAACHNCLYVSETSCERMNEGLDRALVFPVMGQSPRLAFFDAWAAEHQGAALFGGAS